MIIFLKVLVVLVAFGLLYFLGVKLTRTKGKYEDENEIKVKVRPIGLVIGGLLVIASFIMIGAFGQIEPGYRGVVVRVGAVTDRILGEGFYIVLPLADKVETMDVQIHAYEAVAEAASRDLQDASTKVTLNYSVDPTKVNVIYQTLRHEYLERIVKPAVQESVKAITARFEAEELITKRPMVKSEIETALKTRLATHGIIVDTISITDFKFSPEFTKAIESKVGAVQKALEAENKLRQIEVEAKQVETAAKGQANAAIATAEGQKQATIKKAEGDAQARVTVAEAEARAYKMIAEALNGNPDLLKYILIQKIGDDIKVIVLPTGNSFILPPEMLGTNK